MSRIVRGRGTEPLKCCLSRDVEEAAYFSPGMPFLPCLLNQCVQHVIDDQPQAPGGGDADHHRIGVRFSRTSKHRGDELGIRGEEESHYLPLRFVCH
jgi:hypothetical protein